MEKGEDEEGRVFIKVDWNVHDVRLLNNAMAFYDEKWIEHQAEGTQRNTGEQEHIKNIRKTLNSLILENTFYEMESK